MFAKLFAVIALFAILSTPVLAQQDCYASAADSLKTTGPGHCLLMQAPIMGEYGGDESMDTPPSVVISSENVSAPTADTIIAGFLLLLVGLFVTIKVAKSASH